MSVGTAFYPRTAPLNTKLQWREWSGYLAASAYSDSHEIEYNAIREAAALIDVSPLYKYLVSGPDATRLVDRVITRDASKLAVGRVYYTSWCNEDGRVVDDGTVARLEEQTYRWTAADSSLRWLRMNARGLDVELEDVSERISALAVQGPLSRDVLEAATETSWGDLKYFGRRAAQVGSIPVDVSRTGYTGDLGYEVWVESAQAVELWDALVRAGSAYGIRPAGMLALDIARIEAGLILIEVDFDSVRRALIPEQSYSPFELGVLGRFVDFEKPVEFVGRRALEREQGRGGPPRRLVGLELDWEPLEELYRAKGLTPTLEPAASRVPVPVYARGRQIGKATSTTWSPTLKKVVALASVAADQSKLGTRIDVEWTVEARRSRTAGTVVELPFFNPRSATDIGSTRSTSRSCRLPRRRRPFNSVRPPETSARDGDARSGGSVAWTRARKAPSERILRSKATNASASRGCVLVRSSVAVRTGSRHNVRPGPSADGAKAAASGSMARKPCEPSRRSRTTSSRRPPTQSAATGARTPGASSSVARAPPARLRRSRTSVRSPPFARYEAVTRPLWPAPTTTAS